MEAFSISPADQAMVSNRVLMAATIAAAAGAVPQAASSNRRASAPGGVAAAAAMLACRLAALLPCQLLLSWRSKPAGWIPLLLGRRSLLPQTTLLP